jgi:hypothetical protein
VADYNNIDFTIFRDMLPLMEGVREPGPAARAAANRFFITMCSVRYSIPWASRTPPARQSAMPCSCTRRPVLGPHGGGRARSGHRRALGAAGL